MPAAQGWYVQGRKPWLSKMGIIATGWWGQSAPYCSWPLSLADSGSAAHSIPRRQLRRKCRPRSAVLQGHRPRPRRRPASTAPSTSKRRCRRRIPSHRNNGGGYLHFMNFSVILPSTTVLQVLAWEALTKRSMSFKETLETAWAGSVILFRQNYFPVLAHGAHSSRYSTSIINGNNIHTPSRRP